MNYFFELWSAAICRPDVICATGMETIGLIMTAVSAAMSVVGGIQQSQANKANAANAKADAAQAMEQGKAESQRQQRINVARQAELVAAAGASGTTMSGSPMEVYLENAKQGSLEEQDPIYGAKLRARGLNQQADIYNRQATSSLFEGFGGAVKGLAGAGSTLLNAGTATPPKTTVIGSGPFRLPGIPQR
jgi:hypothetical protein